MRQLQDTYEVYEVGTRPLQWVQGGYETPTRCKTKAVMRGARWVQGNYKRYEAATRQLHGLIGRYDAATRAARQV